MTNLNDTIAAIATPPGEGAIGVIRLSGDDAIAIAAKLFSGKDLTKQATRTMHFGRIMDGDEVVDEVVAGIYKGPKSYTGQDTVELSCHGSAYVLGRVMELCATNGARPAKAGEFTMRAFLNGKMDLTQAEAVADLIASHSGAAHKAAIHNLRGGFSEDLKAMREQLIMFSALMELELDFSEEDVEFADRTKFYELIARMISATDALLRSFKLGNAIRDGVSVAITGKPNAGKSTLLNALLNEERAIVSDIAGTTRDTIEETLNINGILFRLIDTAGIREHSHDAIELQGIARSKAAMNKADIVVHLYDLDEALTLPEEQALLRERREAFERGDAKYLLAGNKADKVTGALPPADEHTLYLSAKNKENITALKDRLYAMVADGEVSRENTIVTNARHYAALREVMNSLQAIKEGLDGDLPGDLVSLDVRACLHYLGEITGAITTEDKLDYIFSKFCIGK